MHLFFYIKFILQETVMPLRCKTTGSWFRNYQKLICLVGSVRALKTEKTMGASSGKTAG